jgi:hypothetical protein
MRAWRRALLLAGTLLGASGGGWLDLAGGLGCIKVSNIAAL